MRIQKRLKDFLTEVPFAKDDAERIKYGTFRLIIFVFAALFSLILIAVLIVSATTAIPVERALTPELLIISICALMFYLAVWHLGRTRFYKLSIWIFATFIGVLTNAAYTSSPTETLLYREVIYVYLTVLIMSIFLPRWQLYSLAFVYYCSFVINMTLTGNFDLGTFAIFTSVAAFMISAIELVSRVRAAEARILEQERAQAIHSSRLSTLGETTAFLMHEISSPMTVLNSHLALIRNSENIDLHISKMQGAIDRTIEFTNSVKRMVRASEPNQFEIVQLSEVYKMVWDLIEPNLRQHHILLEFDYSEDAELKCRPAEIAQVIMSLVNNSTDALQNAKEKWIRVSSRTDGDFIEIDVTDPGFGIKSSLSHRIMEPFFTTKPTGSGIGLSIAQQIAEKHDGRIEIIQFASPTIFRFRFARTPRFTQQSEKNKRRPFEHDFNAE